MKWYIVNVGKIWWKAQWKAWCISLQSETDLDHCNPNQQHSSVAWNGILSMWVKFEHNFVFPKHSSCQMYVIYLCYTYNKPWSDLEFCSYDIFPCSKYEVVSISNIINYLNDTIGSPIFEAPCMIIPSKTISSHLCMQTSRILAIHLLQKYI